MKLISIKDHTRRGRKFPKGKTFEVINECARKLIAEGKAEPFSGITMEQVRTREFQNDQAVNEAKKEVRSEIAMDEAIADEMPDE